MERQRAHRWEGPAGVVAAITTPGHCARAAVCSPATGAALAAGAEMILIPAAYPIRDKEGAAALEAREERC